MGNSKSKAAKKAAEAAEDTFNTICVMDEKDQTQRIVEIITKYFPEAEKLTEEEEDFFEKLNITINQIDIPHNSVTKDQYTVFYRYIALSLIQGIKLDDILTNLVNQNGVCFKIVIEQICKVFFKTEFPYVYNGINVSGYKKVLKEWILSLEKEGQVCIVYILLKLAVMFQKQIKGAGAKYSQYCYES